MSLEEFLQSYLWRWGIEVNFREEKNLVGTGDAGRLAGKRAVIDESGF